MKQEEEEEETETFTFTHHEIDENASDIPKVKQERTETSNANNNNELTVATSSQPAAVKSEMSDFDEILNDAESNTTTTTTNNDSNTIDAVKKEKGSASPMITEAEDNDSYIIKEQPSLLSLPLKEHQLVVCFRS